jgi:uncharacterized protein YdhG (YjbR/CyaY superfamily)
MEKKAIGSVEEYIAGFPPSQQERMKKIREIIIKAAPLAVEKIGYGMPSYSHKGVLIYFAGHTNHIGIYPFPSAMEKFKEEIGRYRSSKGTLKIENSEPVPYDLVEEIVKFRVSENETKALLKKKISKTRNK